MWPPRVRRHHPDFDKYGTQGWKALDSEGKLLVFEVDATMLVHDDIKDFPYKDPFVRVIKAAFGAMLQSRASGATGPRGLMLNFE